MSSLAHAEPKAKGELARRVSRPQDRDERQAERAAEVVARGGNVTDWSFASPGTQPRAVHRCAGPGRCSCPRCRATAAVDAATSWPGTALEPGTRRFMEAAFGRDFGSVRLHADSRAAASANALGARAYSVGEHVVTAEGRPRLASGDGRRLLAHELAHVVQHRAAGDSSTVHRQTGPQPGGGASGAGAAATRPQREERFGLGRGGGRLDATLDRSIGWLTAVVKVRFNFRNTPQPWPSEAAKTTWRDSYVAAVTQRWSFKHFLVPDPSCPGEPQQVAVRVQVRPVTSDPHFTMNVGYTTTFQQSSVGGRTATMDALDVAVRSDIPQVPAEHEFGHMLGLPHIHCDSNAAQCYGVTSAERADVMGVGSYVSPHDYGVFAELMPYFTGCNYRVRQASFIPTAAAHS